MADLYALVQAEHDRVWELVNALGDERGDGPGAAAQRRRLARELVSMLSAHELSEELVLWPAVERNCEDGAELAATGREQEHDLKLALNELESISPSPEFDECVNTIAGELRTHLSYEQSQVWPRLADALTAAQAEQLAERWRTARAAAATRPHPHLPADPRLLGPLMPLLAAADRALDALRARIPRPGV